MNDTLRTASLLLIDDQADYLATIREPLEECGYRVLTAESPAEARRVLAQQFVDLLLVDDRLGGPISGTDLLAELRSVVPGLSGILVTGYADLETAVRAMRAGALDLLQKPVPTQALLVSLTSALAQSEVTREARYQRWRASEIWGFPQIIGSDPSLSRVLNRVTQVAATGASVLIQGESGTGKELVARAIHERSPRRGKPFVPVNCGALPQTLLETTLFGSKKGAFTDSKEDQPGLFEAAHLGTLFLDEIGETTPDVQVRLLRVLQERLVTRVGDTKEIPVDVRVIAATNRDLRVECEEKRFRTDLYYRLAVITVMLPPLRERINDIPELVGYFLERRAKELGKAIRGVSAEAIDLLKRYPWPGNVRELDNVIQRAIIVTERDTIGPEALSLEPASQRLQDFIEILDRPYREAIRAFNQKYFSRLLARVGGNKSKAADEAGIDRTALYDHLNKLAPPRIESPDPTT